jgi:hypothetical protein
MCKPFYKIFNFICTIIICVIIFCGIIGSLCVALKYCCFLDLLLQKNNSHNDQEDDGDLKLKALWKKLDAIFAGVTLSPPSSSFYASRFVTLFQTQNQYTAPTYYGNTLLILCKREGACDNEKRWRKASPDADVLYLPSSFTHSLMMYLPCIKLVAGFIKTRVEYSA